MKAESKFRNNCVAVTQRRLFAYRINTLFVLTGIIFNIVFVNTALGLPTLINSQRSYNKTSQSVANVTFTNSATNQSLLLAMIGIRGDESITSVSWHGTPLNHAVTSTCSSFTNQKVAIYYLASPATGTRVLTINFDKDVLSKGIVLLTYEGVNPSSPVDQTETNCGNGQTYTVSPYVSSGAINIGMVSRRHGGSDGAAFTPLNGVTELFDFSSDPNSSGSGVDSFAVGYEIGAADGVNSFTFTNSTVEDNRKFAISTVEINSLPDAVIYGQVTLSGDGVNNVTLNLTGSTTASTTTDSSGGYLFQIQTYNNYTITPSKTGYTFSPVNVSGTLTGLTEHNFTAIPNTYTLSGNITVGGSPLAGVAVDGGALGMAITNISGDYSFANVPHDTAFTLTPSLFGYTFSPASSSGTITGPTITNFTATLNSYMVSGNITRSGSPLSGVSVNGGVLGNTTTDAAGNYFFANVPHGTSYTITPSLANNNFSPTNVSGTVTSNTSHNFTAAWNTYSISGTVTRDGSPLSGVTVDGGALGSDVTDASGNYAFSNVAHGTSYSITPSLAGNTFSPINANGTLTANITHNFAATMNTYTISGSITENGVPLSGVIVDGGTIGSQSTNGSGLYSFTNVTYGTNYLITPSSSGYTFSPSNASGIVIANVTANFAATDALPPSAPNITSPTNGDVINDNTPSFSGTAEPNSTVEIFDSGTSLGTATVDGSGNWSFTPSSPLSEGSHTFTASATDGAGNTGPASGTVNVEIDFSAPTAPVITTPYDNSFTNDVDFPIAGTAEPDATVEVKDSNGNSLGIGTANSGGLWSINANVPVEATYVITAIATDGAGNNSLPSTSITFTVDLTEPVQVVITAPADGASTNDATPLFTGTAEPNSQVKVFDTTGSPVYLGDTIADGAGNWSYTPSTPLSEGTRSFVANATDAASNTGPISNSVTLTFDLTEPTAPVITNPADGTTSNDNTPTISGTAEPNSTVEIFDGSTSLGSITANGSGNWTFTVSSALLDGNHSFTATATDATGNTSPASGTVTLTVDTSLTISGIITKDGAPLSGVAVELSGDLTQSTSTDGSGNYSFTGIPHNSDYTVSPSDVGYTFSPTNYNGSLIANQSGFDFSAAVATFTISGTIIVDGNPLPGVTVTLSGDVSGTTTTDTRGNYSFPNIPYGSNYTITPTIPGYTFSPASFSGVADGNPVNPSFTATLNKYNISGTITDNASAPVSGASVNLSGAVTGSTTTNGSGSYSFTDIPHGSSYTLTVAKAGITFSDSPSSGTLTGDLIKNFSGSPSNYTISGSVSVNGSPASGVTVNLSGGITAQQVTSGSGSFSFTGIPAGTNYVVTPSAANTTFTPISASGTLNNNVSLNFTGNLSLSISGTVRLANLDGDPVAGAVVSNGTIEVTTDAFGNYTFSNLSPGTYKLSATKDEFTINIDALSDTFQVSNTSLSNINFYAKPSLPNPIYVLWNGFIDLTNIVEIVNTGDEPLRAVVSLYQPGGISSGGPAVKFKFTMAAKSQQDLILNDMPGFQKDSYGFATIQFNADTFDGRTFYYRSDKEYAAAFPGDGAFDFAYSVPFSHPITGTTYMTFNTYQPSANPAEAGHVVGQWLTITNLDPAAKKKFTIRRYNESGNIFMEEELKINPMGRVDIQGGHENPGPNRVGLIEVIPFDQTAKYFAVLQRYGTRSPLGEFPKKYDFATSLQGLQGNGRKQYLAASNVPGTAHYVEVANTTNSTINVNMFYYNNNGVLQEQVQSSISAHSLKHFFSGSYLAPNTTGMVKIVPDLPNSVYALGVTYRYHSATMGISAVDFTHAQESFGKDLAGTYNLFLGMQNWLRIINVTNASTNVNLKVYTNTGGLNERNVVIPANGRMDFALHNYSEFGTAANSYSTFTVEPSTIGAVIPELLRAKPMLDGTLDFSATTAVR